MSKNKKIFYAFLILVTAFFILRLPTLFELPGLDQTLFAYIGQGMQQGKLLYHDLWDHKPPGIFFLYTGLSYLSGIPPWIIPLTDLIWTLLTMGALFLLARKIWDIETALGAAFIFALFSLSPAFQGSGSRTQAEILMNLPLILCFYAGYQAYHKEKNWLWFLSGLALGTAFLIKFTVLLLALPLLPLLWASVSNSTSSKKPILFRLFLLSLGFITMTAAAGLYLYLKGVLAEAYEALWTFNRIYSSLRFDITNIPSFLFMHLKREIFSALALFLLIVLGLRKAKLFRSLAGQMLILWIGGALLAIYLQGKYLWYHFLSLIPPFSLAAALCLNEIKKINFKTFQFKSLLIIVLLAVAIGDSSIFYFKYYQASFSFLFKKADYEQAVRSIPTNTRKLPLVDLGRYIARNTPEKNYIYVWGIAPEVYYYARRPAANRFIFHYYLMNAQNRLANEFPGITRRRQQLLTDLKSKQVEFFLVRLEGNSIFEPQDTLTQLNNFKELDLYLKNNFSFSEQKNDFLIFQRIK